MQMRNKRRSRSPQNIQGRKSKKTDNTQSQVSLQKDDSSVDTVKQTNGTMEGNTIDREFFSFLQVRFTVNASKKGTVAMREKLQTLIKTFREADESLVFTVYKTDSNKSNANLYTCAEKNTLQNPKDIPDSITAIGKYFYGAKPNSNGGLVWTQVRIAHTNPIENIIADTEFDLREDGIFVSLQVIQHWEVAQLGFLKNLHPDIDTEAMSLFFNTAAKAYHRSGKIFYGLKVKAPYDGTKKIYDKKKTTPINYRQRTQAVHIEVKAEHKEVATKALKNILASPKFRGRYNCEVRLIPLFDRNSSPYTQDKIRRCIVQHGQYCQCTDMLHCEGIAHLDQKNLTLKKTLRELILALPEAHFINIDLNWKKDSYQILFPKKYDEIARGKIAHLGTYLHREYGDSVLTSLPVEAQQIIHETTWDEEKQRPISKLDKELDDILDAGDALEYVDLELINLQEKPATQKPKISDKFIPLVDNSSVSTFGTVHSNSPKRSTTGLALITGSSSTMSEVTEATMESRVSKMEEDCVEIKNMLRTLINHKTMLDKPAKLTQNSSSESAVPVTPGSAKKA